MLCLHLIISSNKLNFKIVAPAKMALLGSFGFDFVFFLLSKNSDGKEMENILFCIFESEQQLITKTND